MYISTNPHRYESDDCSLGWPQTVGHISINADQSIRFDKSNARYLDFPRVHDPSFRVDLNAGYERFDNRRNSPEVAFNALSDWIMAKSNRGNNLKSMVRGADVVCFRGILKKIAATPYSKDSWSLMAVKKRGVVFICEQERNDERRSEYLDRATYWGCKFEKCMQLNPRTGRSYMNSDVVFGDQYRVVVENTVGNSRSRNLTRLLYCGEVDALDEDDCLVEMKTQQDCLSDNFWRHKARDTYIQCQLLGVPQVVIGLRDRHGLLKKIEYMPPKDLLYYRKDWEYDVCINFLSHILMDVRNTLQDNDMCYYDYNGGRGVDKSDVMDADGFEFLSDRFASFVRHRCDY